MMVKNHFSNLLICKGVYPYDYMDTWETFLEASLPKKRNITIIDTYCTFAIADIYHDIVSYHDVPAVKICVIEVGMNQLHHCYEVNVTRSV